MVALARLPIREVVFAVALLLAAGVSGWVSGRSMILPELLRPGMLGIQATWSLVRGGAGYLQDLERLRHENRNFRVRVDGLQRELTRRIEVDSEVVRLRQLLGLASSIPGRYRVGRIIGRTPDNWHERAFVDKGRKHGVEVDAVVMAPQGVVGRIMQAGSNIAEISLLTDPGNQVSCLNQRSRSPGIVAGEGESSLVMRYLQQQIDLRVGDTMVTSGLGGVYPRGLPLGKVARVMRQSHSITPHVTIVPEADLDRLEEVLILDPLPGLMR